MADFPTFGGREDSSKFGFETEDVGIRSPTEGGYVLTRPRFTRPPRRTWMTGFTALTQDELDTFLEFWNSKGTYKAFTYIVPTTSELVNVRFSQKPEFKYVGMGLTYLWEINGLKLEEV